MPLAPKETQLGDQESQLEIRQQEPVTAKHTTTPQVPSHYTSTEQKPSVGRIVHYTYENHVFAAIVTEVHAGNKVNLSIFRNSHGMNFFHDNVEYGTGENQWFWPPKV